jgi:hypothetical protein
MSWVAVGMAGAAVVGGMMSARSSKRAGKQQAAAIREATALQREMYNTTRKDLSQYRDVGGKYMGQLDNNMPDLTKSFTMSDFNKDPGYDFRMQEGAKALERTAAARGGLMGGAAGKAMARYGQDYASNEYSNAYNRFNSDRDQRFSKLSSLANIGLNAAGQSGQAAQNFGNQAGQNIIGGGNAQAASTIAQGNAWSNAAQGVIGAAAMYGNNNYGGGGNVSKLTNWAGNDYQPANLSQMIKATA